MFKTNRILMQAIGLLALASFSAGCEKTPAPDTTDEDFRLEVSQVTTTKFTLDCFPADKEMTYLLMVSSQEYLDKNGIDDDESLYQDDIRYIREEMSYGTPIEELTKTGDMTGLEYAVEPEKEIVVYAYGIDPSTLERLTEICYKRFTTPAVEMTDVKFAISTEVNGPDIRVEITPDGYEGYYFFEAVETATLEQAASAYEYAYDSFSANLSYYLWMSDSLEEALESLCWKGSASDTFTGDPETSYTIMAYAVNDEGLVCSEPEVVEVTTEAVGMSGNELTISVTGIKSRSALLSVTPSDNEDPYTCAVVTDEEIAGKSEEEIIRYILDYYWYNLEQIYGPFSEDLTELEPGTGYTVCAFGYQANTATTSLFSEKFTTPEAVEGKSTFELSLDKYYDVGEVAELDPDIINELNLAPDVEALLTTEVTTVPETDEFYYLITGDSAIDTMSEDELKEYCYNFGNTGSKAIFGHYYGVEQTAVGFAVDTDGNWGPLWKKTFTPTRDGVSDPSGVIAFKDSISSGAQ